LLVPRDVLAAPAVAQLERGGDLGRCPLDRPRPERTAIERAAELLATARRPLVIAGGGVHLSGAGEALAALQEVASLPVATTTMGKGAVDEAHPLAVGVVGSFMGANSFTRSLRPMVTDADVILLVGTRTNENGTDGWHLYPEAAAYLHLDVAPEGVGRNYESVRLVGDARSGLEDLIEALGRRDLTRRTEYRAEVAAQIAQGHLHDRAEATAVTASDQAPIRPERVMAELDRLLDPDDIVVTDASYSTIWVAAYLRSRRAGQRFISPRGLAGLGWGLPMALGAKVAEPERAVVCVVGDGAFAHTWPELETAVRESLPLTVILLNNGILGFQQHAELHTWGAHTSAVEFGPVDHAAIARACGAVGLVVDDPDDLAPVLAEALAGEVISVVEVMIDPQAHPPITAWDDSEGLAEWRAAAGE
jgi:acetolactate synthase-1/2/3 large subunit